MAEILKDVFEDDKGNKYYLANNTEITYDQAGIPLNNGGDLSEASVNFSVGTARKALTPKARFKSLMGDIAKWLTDLGTAAFCNVANNDTTTVSGFVADARIVKQHGDEIDGINSDLAGYQFRVNNGVPEYKAGADAVWVPFKREPIISTASFSWAYSPVQTFPAKEGYKIIGLYVDITGINSSDYVNVNFGISKNLETGKISITGQTGVNIMGKFYCVYA